MNARAQSAVLAVLLAACLPLALAPVWAAAPSSGKWGGKTYKWVDEQGVTHYGDSVPPEYAQRGRTELNRNGLEIGQVAKQLNGEEAAAAQKAALEQQKLRQHDSFLMTTYTSAKDIEQLRDERLALLNGQMEIARGSIDSTTQRLTSLEARMRNFKPWAATSTRRLPDQLVEEVVRTLQERNSLLAALASRETEKKEMRAQFESDLSRYRVLTEGPKPAPISADSIATR